MLPSGPLYFNLLVLLLVTIIATRGIPSDHLVSSHSLHRGTALGRPTVTPLTFHGYFPSISGVQHHQVLQHTSQSAITKDLTTSHLPVSHYPFSTTWRLMCMAVTTVGALWLYRSWTAAKPLVAMWAVCSESDGSVKGSAGCTRRILFTGVALGLGAGHSDAAELQEAYDQYAATYDDLDGGWVADALGIKAARTKLLSNARGNVLEVAVGTGLNLPLYQWATVDQVTAIDFSAGMLREADRKRQQLLDNPEKVQLQQMDARSLSFPDASFDTVIDTFSLCVFEDPPGVLREMRRVCRQDGVLLLLENSRSPNGAVAAYQDLTAPLIAATGGKGCAWNQNVEALVTAAGFRVQRSEPIGGGFFRLVIATPVQQ